MDDLTELTIAEAAAALEHRRISASELTEAYLARISRLQPMVNAYITVTAARAREDAKRADADIAGGGYRGPLHGIPIGLKDLYDTAGILTTAGSKILATNVPAEDCTVARKLRESGSVLLGKTLTHEFAWGATSNNPHYGPCRNPWDTDRVPGGSSGGSGAAIVAGMAAGTLGTDTGGSIRIPAAMCGCVGFKPTFGRVSKQGVAMMSWEMDHPGPITKTVEDAAIMLQAIAGYDPADFATVRTPVPDFRAEMRAGVRGLRVGVPRGYFFDLLDPEVRSSVEAAIGTLRTLGAEVIDADPGFTREQIHEAWAIVYAESQEFHGPNFEMRKADFGEDLQAVLSIPVPDARGQAARMRLKYVVTEGLRRVLDTVDVLVTPTSMRTAPIIGEEPVLVDGMQIAVGGALASLTMPFNVSGLPALAMPCGFDSQGLPVSLQIVGRPFDESTVIRTAWAYEQATGWHRRRPELG